MLAVVIGMLQPAGCFFGLCPPQPSVFSKMYVTNYNNTVTVANLDGTGGTSLGDLDGTPDDPSGIALGL